MHSVKLGNKYRIGSGEVITIGVDGKVWHGSNGKHYSPAGRCIESSSPEDQLVELISKPEMVEEKANHRLSSSWCEIPSHGMF